MKSIFNFSKEGNIHHLDIFSAPHCQHTVFTKLRRTVQDTKGNFKSAFFYNSPPSSVENSTCFYFNGFPKEKNQSSGKNIEYSTWNVITRRMMRSYFVLIIYFNFSIEICNKCSCSNINLRHEVGITLITSITYNQSRICLQDKHPTDFWPQPAQNLQIRSSIMYNLILIWNKIWGIFMNIISEMLHWVEYQGGRRGQENISFSGHLIYSFIRM